MDKVTAVIIRYADGTYSDEVPISVDAINVEMTDGSDVETVLNTLSSNVETNTDSLTWNKIPE